MFWSNFKKGNIFNPSDGKPQLFFCEQYLQRKKKYHLGEKEYQRWGEKKISTVGWKKKISTVRWKNILTSWATSSSIYLQTLTSSPNFKSMAADQKQYYKLCLKPFFAFSLNNEKKLKSFLRFRQTERKSFFFRERT